LTSVLASGPGGWGTVFLAASVLNIVAALLAWFVLRPMRRKLIESTSDMPEPPIASMSFQR
ncbi:MAG: oxalate/formate antiporter, partial [Pseudomonadota bacterium]